MDSIGRGPVMFSSTKSGATRSFFDKVISHRSGWILRDRDLLIRRWGNMLWYHLRVYPVYYIFFILSYLWLLSLIRRFNGNFTTNTMKMSDINYHVKELK